MLLSDERIQKVKHFNSLIILIVGILFTGLYIGYKKPPIAIAVFIATVPQYLILRIFSKKIKIEYQIIVCIICGCIACTFSVFAKQGTAMVFISLSVFATIQAAYYDMRFTKLYILISNLPCIWGVLDVEGRMIGFDLKLYIIAWIALNCGFVFLYILTKISISFLSKSIKAEEKALKLSTEVETKMKETQLMMEKQSNIMQTVDKVAASVNNSSEELSHVVDNLADGSATQAGAIEQFSSTIQEIATKSDNNARNANSLMKMTKLTSIEMKKGNVQMKEMLTSMQEIKKVSEEIKAIITNINDIAFQTNILSLNAAIEAARAGYTGKGFAVVANEVKELATKSAFAAKNTEELINTATLAVDKGASIANQTAETMHTLDTKATKSTSIVEKIHEASKEQVISISELSSGIEQISQVTQQTSATSEETAAASHQLYKQAQQLNEIVQTTA